MSDASAPRPNIVLICCDHLRADWLGVNGHPHVMTPQIDTLAYQGANFTRSMSECPVCVPARRILMTGQDTFGINMVQNKDTQPFPEGPKLAEVLTRAGYQTFASGKLHTWPQRNRIGFEEVQLNEEGRRQGGLKRDDYDADVADAGYAHRTYLHGLGNNQYGLRLSPLPTELTTTQWTADKAMEFVERRDPTRPFFLYVSFDKPHPPITPPREYWELYRDVVFDDPIEGDWVADKSPQRTLQMRLKQNHDDLQRNKLPVQQSLQGFAAMITHIDSMVGTIRGQLRDEGVEDDTWILFTSDHGDHLFDHGDYAKGNFLQSSCRVPYIVMPSPRWRRENGFKPGVVDAKTPAGLADIMPTLLEIAGVDIPATVQGQSVLPRLQSPDGGFRRYTFGHCQQMFGVSDGRYRLQWCGDENVTHLFDQDADLRDQYDLADDARHAGVVDRLKGALIDWLQANEDPHVVDGKLTTVPFDWELGLGKAHWGWNNRGRR